jgi:hypothetical protein
MLHVAQPHEAPTLMKAFQAYPNVFPFLRQDFLRREIAAGHVLYDFGAVAIVKQMRRRGRSGTWSYPAGTWQMPEIVRTPDAGPWGVLQLFRGILQDYVQDHLLFGTVRDDNTQSVRWHQAMGYTRVGDIAWKQGTLPGGVWLYDAHLTKPFDTVGAP